MPDPVHIKPDTYVYPDRKSLATFTFGKCELCRQEHSEKMAHLKGKTTLVCPSQPGSSDCQTYDKTPTADFDSHYAWPASHGSTVHSNVSQSRLQCTELVNSYPQYASQIEQLYNKNAGNLVKL